MQAHDALYGQEQRALGELAWYRPYVNEDSNEMSQCVRAESVGYVQQPQYVEVDAGGNTSS